MNNTPRSRKKKVNQKQTKGVEPNIKAETKKKKRN